MSFGQLVVENRHGSKHELLKGHPWWELGPIQEREPATARDEVVVVAIVLDQVRCVTGKAGEEGYVVVADDAIVVVVLRDTVVYREDRTVRLGERDLTAHRRVRYDSGDGYGCRVCPTDDVVHEE